jgi:uncharacterized iron-regulated membrane protein
MSVSERSSVRKEHTWLPLPSKITLLVAIALGFMLLHVVAGLLLLPSGSGLITPQEQASVSSSD